MPAKIAWIMKARLEVEVDHSSQGIRSWGTPYMNKANIPDHLMNRPIEWVSSSTKRHQSYKHHTNSAPYNPIVYSLWVGLSTTSTGIIGAFDSVVFGDEAWGRLGSDVLTFGTSWGLLLLDSELILLFGGVDGNDDRRRGVPFMACSLILTRSRWTFRSKCAIHLVYRQVWSAQKEFCGLLYNYREVSSKWL